MSGGPEGAVDCEYALGQRVEVRLVGHVVGRLEYGAQAYIVETDDGDRHYCLPSEIVNDGAGI